MWKGAQEQQRVMKANEGFDIIELSALQRSQ